jgi:SWI/SNF-related matrix-associated actin-dependent regulator 1 of chromatin subfamily A
MESTDDMYQIDSYGKEWFDTKIKKKGNPIMGTILYTFQKTAVQKMKNEFHRCLLADEMGLGKSAMVLHLLKRLPKLRPAIIVCPASLKLQWKSEVMKHIETDACILEGTNKNKKSTKFLDHEDIIIINYDILKHWEDILISLNPMFLAADECQMISSQKAIRTKSFKKISENVERVICASGTPFLNNPIELWSVLNILKPELFPKFFPFAMRYSIPRKMFYGWAFKGARNLGELNDILTKNLMIRRRKIDVLDELPDNLRFVVLLDIENRKEYQEAEDDLIKWLAKTDQSKADSASQAEKLVKIGYLKRLAAKLKSKAVVEWVNNFLKESDDKLILFSIHKSIMANYGEVFKKNSVTIDARKSNSEKDKAVTSFTHDKNIRILNGQLETAGKGLNLIAAGTTATTELGWTSGVHRQAEARIDRIGQKRKKVFHYYLIAKGTIEEYICKVLQEKQEFHNQAIDGQKVVQGGLNLMDEVESYLKGKK